MTLSLFYFSLWLIMRGSSFVRPSALHRGFVLIWLFVFGWIIQVFGAVLEDRMHIAALYSAVFLQSAVFVALLISLLEQFALLKKQDFAMQLHDAHLARDHSSRPILPTGGDGEQDGHEGEEGDDHHADSATERTPLRAGEPGYGSNNQTSFANTYRRSVSEHPAPPATVGSYQPFEFEQAWSGRLPSWTWFLQFLLLAVVPIILFGNLGLVAMSALHMTGTDGGSLLIPLLSVGIMSIFLLLPIAPFIHRVTHHVPMFLLCVFVASLIYNLTAFPFSTNHRFNLRFQQVLDLDNGMNTVALTGVEEYVRHVISTLPVAAGQDVECEPTVGRDLMDCKYDASKLPPKLVPGKDAEELMSFSALEGGNEMFARFQLQAVDTRVCFVQVSKPVYGFSVEGGGSRDPRFGSFPQEGLQSIILWRRDRHRPWNVTLNLNEDSKRLDDNGKNVNTEDESDLNRGSASEPLEIKVSCSWSDANKKGTIPAFHELVQFMPTWAVVTKKNVGLVEVRKTYKLKR